ncbi:GNAT family N-acetyltransferase [Actinoplanes philippinensis]|uniref:Acetyltransferase (GNAT) domain-containing protein n=1 Tax=Actinoplanes philippinensis TaxID=35752 RepID=A0A1I2I0D8_9ACTN|nr:GNAT family N-acetyltransferase [Actinoplanes philippinensis]SFF35083.1 Acetyltransferase (GNAT) domain-containing protein [Actinoplanes philippinensis]
MAIRFLKLSPTALAALLDGDLDAAGSAAGHPLSPFLIEENWLWEIRLDDIRRDPRAADWIARAAIAEPEGVVVGHGGFHGPPDADGVVEVAYTVAPQYRLRGYARQMLEQLLARADADPEVTAVRASIRPDNIGSKKVIAGFGFRKIGEQWDPEDGLEDVYLRPATGG